MAFTKTGPWFQKSHDEFRQADYMWKQAVEIPKS